MRFEPCASVFKLMKSGLEEEKPYWSYEDIGVFSIVLAVLGPILHLFARLHLLSRSELENPGRFRSPTIAWVRVCVQTCDDARQL